MVSEQAVAVDANLCADAVAVADGAFQPDFDPPVVVGNGLEHLGVFAYEVVHQVGESIQVVIACHRRKRQRLHIEKSGGILVENTPLVVEEVIWDVRVVLENRRPRSVGRKPGAHVQVLPTVVVHVKPRAGPAREVHHDAVPFYRVVQLEDPRSVIQDEVIAFKHPRRHVQVLVVVPVKIRGRRAHGIDGIVQFHIVRIVEEIAILCLLVVLVLKANPIANEIQIQQPIFVEVHPLALKILRQRLAHREVERDLFEVSTAQVPVELIERRVLAADVIGNEQIEQPVVVVITEARPVAPSVGLVNAALRTDIRHHQVTFIDVKPVGR